MYAVPVDALNAIIFLRTAPPKGYEDYHGTPQGRISLDYPQDVYLWPRGADSPDVILARDRESGQHYRVFKYMKDYKNEKSEWEDTGRNFCVATGPQFIDLIKAVIRSRHSGQWIAWADDGKRLLAAAETPEQVNAAVERSGEKSAVFEWIEPSPSRPARIAH